MAERLCSFVGGAIFLALTLTLLPASNVTYAQGATTTSAPLSEGTVRSVQQALNQQGIVTPVDGVLGDATRAAIRQYQSQHHLPVTGDPDTATLAKLGVAVSQNAIPTGPATQAPAMGPAGMQAMPQGMMMPMAPQNRARMAQDEDAQGATPTPGGTTPMQAGMVMCPMMDAMMRMAPTGMPMEPRTGMMGPMGPAMAEQTLSSALLYGMPRHVRAPLSIQRVESMLEGVLSWHGNERLRVGELRPTDLGEILADIETKDGSLVQRLAIDRRTGGIRQVD